VALRSLRRRKARSAFLVAGLLIGIATVVALLTLSASLSVGAQMDLEHYGANIVVTPDTDRLSLAYGDVAVGAVTVGAREIREAHLARIPGIPNSRNIAIVAPKLLGAVEVRGRQVVLMGVRPGDEFRLKQWWTLDGRPPRAGRQELVAGSSAAAALGLEVGDTIAVDGAEFRVTGVLEPTGAEDDGLLVTDLGVAQRLLGRPGRITMIEVAALCHDCPVEDIVEQLDAVLPGTRVVAMQQVVRNRMEAMDQFRTFSFLVAAVIILIEALVVFVTMMGSVNARTREIGVFRALGFRRGHVVGLILTEAALAGLLAGALGYLAGMAASHGALPLLARGSDVSVAWSPALAAGAVALALVIGSLASLYPALRAGRLDPTVALRAL
jgi:putative ABC transport system permease protein